MRSFEGDWGGLWLWGESEGGGVELGCFHDSMLHTYGNGKWFMNIVDTDTKEKECERVESSSPRHALSVRAAEHMYLFIHFSAHSQHHIHTMQVDT